MKPALITNYWNDSGPGGIKTYTVNLVDAMQDKGADVSVLFREGDDPEHFCGGKNKVAFSLACYRQLRKIRPEVIYSQGTWYCLLPGVLYKKLHGCTLVHTFHTEPDRGLPLPARVFFQSLLNACDLFVLPSLNEGNPVIIFEPLDCCRKGLCGDNGWGESGIEPSNTGNLVAPDKEGVRGEILTYAERFM